MTRRRKILLAAVGVWLLGSILIVAVFGFTRRDNEEFQPQEEFRLEPWVDLPGPFDITKAVMYLVIAAILTVATMVYVARRMRAFAPPSASTSGRSSRARGSWGLPSWPSAWPANARTASRRRSCCSPRSRCTSSPLCSFARSRGTPPGHDKTQEAPSRRR